MIHSFLMIGQSNMAGRGLLDEAETIDTAHIKILRNGRWQPMFRPINPDRPFSGVNLAESFAEQYAQTYGVDVGLIPCADGGTSLRAMAAGRAAVRSCGVFCPVGATHLHHRRGAVASGRGGLCPGAECRVCGEMHGAIGGAAQTIGSVRRSLSAGRSGELSGGLPVGCQFGTLRQSQCSFAANCRHATDDRICFRRRARCQPG